MTHSFISYSHWAQLEDKMPVYSRQFRVYETHVVVDAGNILLGLDNNGFRHVLIPIATKQSSVEDRKSSGVHIVYRELMDGPRLLHFIDVVCLKKHLQELFTTLADEILTAISVNQAEPSNTCSKILNQWRELLERSRPAILGDEEITGLFGELVYVRDMVKGGSLSLEFWTGPDKGKYDIIKNNIALEIKTTTARVGRFVEIHGVDQLDPPAGCQLYLAFIRLEKNTAKGESIPELIESIVSLGVDHIELITLLAHAGYDPHFDDEYRKFRFVVTENKLYPVVDVFPRIIPASFSAGSIPNGVTWIRYQIDLTNEPPFPLSGADAELIYKNISGVQS